MVNKLLGAVAVLAIVVVIAVPTLCLELGQPFADVIFSFWNH